MKLLTPTPQIFISYAREDSDRVLPIYTYLEQRGFPPFMDKRDLVGGESWEHALTRAVRKSDFFVFCASRNSVTKRGAIQREIKEALDVWKTKLEDDIFFIPVRLEPCEVPESIRVFQWIDWFEPDGFRRLERSIHEGLARLHGHEKVGEIQTADRCVASSAEDCYSVDVHYPEFQLSFTPDIAAINATISSFAIRMARRFERRVSATPGETRRKSVPEGFALPDFLNLSYLAEFEGQEFISMRFEQVVYFMGAAHPNSFTRTFNFRRHPFSELDLDDVLRPDGEPLKQVSEYCISVLLKENRERYGDTIGDEWVREGASVQKGNFSRFLISPSELRFIFDPYEVGSYAEGRREVMMPMEVAADLLDPEIGRLLRSDSVAEGGGE